MIEVWKPIPGFPDYEASNLGKVRSLKRKTVRILSPSRNPRGYLGVNLCNNGRTYAYIHSLVMLAFVGPRPAGMHTCHNDDNPSNNRLDNLRYDTPSSNQQDCTKNGKRALTVEQVRQIRQDRSNGIILRKLAEKYGISLAQAGFAVRGTTYNFIGDSVEIRQVNNKRARSIREEYAKGHTTYDKLAKKYSLDKSAISLIVNGKRGIEAGGPIKGKDY